MLSTLRFASKDATRVEETWKQFVPSASLQKVDRERLRFDWFSAEMTGTSVVQYQLAAQVRSIVEPADQLMVCRVESDDVVLESGRSVLDPGMPWITDGHRVQGRWDDTARVRALIFDRAAAQSLARRMSGDDAYRLRMKSLAPANPAAAAQWEKAFAYVASSLEHAQSDDDLVIAGLRRHALWVTLTSFDTGFSDSLEAVSQRGAAVATVRRAIDFIDENAHRPITVDDVAVAAHISTRGLQYAFRRSLDSTPAEQLRRARLEGAHREILAGDASTVGEIARRWGFAHPSRFATAYRQAYGATPAEALRRSRGD